MTEVPTRNSDDDVGQDIEAIDLDRIININVKSSGREKASATIEVSPGVDDGYRTGACSSSSREIARM
jgi:hypothetical protein